MTAATSPKTHWDRPAHFIGSEACRFGMADVVGGYIVSSCGDYRPSGAREPIGYKRFFETMVFRDSGRRCEASACPCGGLPEAEDYSELDSDGYQTAEEAREGHARMVEKYRAASPASETR